jgi:hypothetical protein
VSTAPPTSITREPLQVLAEGGSLGFLAYAALFVWLARRGLQTFRGSPDRDNQLLTAACLLGVTGFLVISLVSVASRHMSVNLCAVTCMSVIVPGQISGNALSQPKPGNRRRSWAVLAILGVGLVVAGAALHPWLQSFAQLRDYNRALDAGEVGRILAIEDSMREARNPRLRHARLRRLYISNDVGEPERDLANRSTSSLDYRDTRFYQAYVQLSRGQYAGAQRLATQYQASDFYHRDTWLLLAALAVSRQDLKLFERQLALMTQYVFYRENVLGSSDPRQVTLRVGTTKDGLLLERIGSEYVVTVDRDFLYGLNTADPGIKEELLSRLMTSKIITAMPAPLQASAKAGLRNWVDEFVLLLEA